MFDISFFPDFFRKTQANKGYWGEGSFFGGKKRNGRIMPVSADENFNQVWSKIEPLIASNEKLLNIYQFLALNAIIINETGGTYKPVSENGDLKYMFGTNNGKKKSYNTYPANKTAFDLFNDSNFLESHKTLPYYDYVMENGKSNTVWKSHSYPKNFPLDPAYSGIIAEADFFKFRGRGFIQTTFRGNYLSLIEVVQNYMGSNEVIIEVKNRWKDLDSEIVATISTNTDWDTLFMNTQHEFACLAVINFLEKKGDILNLKTEDDKVLMGTGPGSLHYLGYRIGGTHSYGKVFSARVNQMYNWIKKEGIINRIS